MSENETPDQIDNSSGADPRMLARVRALLAKAESTTFPDEAEALTAKAVTLMSQYGISERAARQKAGTKRSMMKKDIKVTGSYVPQQKSLLGNLAEVYGVYTLFSVDPEEWAAYVARVDAYNAEVRSGWVTSPKPKPPKRTVAKLHGYDVDIERAEFLFTSLRLQSYAALASVTEVPWYYSGNLRSYRTSYYDGWISRVVARVEEAEKGQVKAASTDLVLVNPIKEAEEFANSMLDRKPKTPKDRRTNAAAWAAGYEAGERVDIDQTRIGEQRKVLTG